MFRRPALTFISSIAVAGLVLAGCGSEESPSSSGTAETSAPPPESSAPPPESTAVEIEPLTIQASFYPLAWMAERVGGDLVEVTNLSPPGSEPHDLELTPQSVAAIADADLVVFLSGFQPSVDDAIETAGTTSFDAAEFADLNRTLAEGDGHDHSHGAEGDGHDHSHEGEEDHKAEGDDKKAETDPHFWLDPTRLITVADAFADTLAEQQPAQADEFRANADEVIDQLKELDREVEEGLAECTSRDLVTSHAAFGYFAARYDFEPIGIAGLTTSEEPSAGRLAEVADFVRDNGVTTIYFETLVSPAIAETIAAETGASTDVLDPLEGLTDESQGSDYFEVMRANLANLRAGQPCP